MSSKVKDRIPTPEEIFGTTGTINHSLDNGRVSGENNLTPVLIKGAIVIGTVVVVCVVVNEVIKRQNDKMLLEMKRINLEQIAMQKKRDEEVRAALSAQLKKALDELNLNMTAMNLPTSAGLEMATA